jgi:two-component system CheB/CheR fusion protein
MKGRDNISRSDLGMPNASGFPIVGVGASAGGVEALEGLFKGMPVNPGVGIVVVTHLNPERESVLHEIISRYTQLDVQKAVNGAKVKPNCVFVLPADAVLGIAGGRLQVSKVDATHRERKPIDIFLSALAKDQGECAASIILSGLDGDGTLGTKAVKERGGLTMAQTANGYGPSHSSMPDSAIGTGYVDFAIPVEHMGNKLAEFAHSLAMLDGLAAESSWADGENEWKDARQEMYAILRNQVGHDFGGYKTKTFLRRVNRRMQVVQLKTVESYVERLRQDPKEVGALFRDLLINVTNFFRDADAFEGLKETVIPKLFEGRGADDTVRIWIPGCATGEEVFSIAILMREYMDKLTALPRVQIFATDIDEHALAVARAGRYPEALMDTVSAERRKRFFIANGGSYVVTKDVRDLCIFSPHSVIRDPPFSRIDLVSCRNLLIYFGADMQGHVIPIFHYSLRPGGYLFLGTSENVNQFAELFTPVEKKQRIFRSRSTTSAPVRLPMAVNGLLQSAVGRTDLRLSSPVPGLAWRQAIESRVLERFGPAFVVATRDGEVVHFSANTDKYLAQLAGAPSRQLLMIARKGLRYDLRVAFREAVDTGKTIVRDRLTIEGDSRTDRAVRLTVEPIGESNEEEALYLALFEGQEPAAVQANAQKVTGSAEGAVAHLERELAETKERLQSLIEEYETALEELKSSNEELVSVNEELQSTNEELEASKEELQSVNEELNTVNLELGAKVEALDRANADLHNLFESTQIATVFLDKNLVIRSFTPAVTRIFNILPNDRGRPITDLASRLFLPELAADVKKVLTTGAVIEHKINHEEGNGHFLVRLVPYREGDQRANGVVVTFIDVTGLALAEAQLRTLVSELNHRVKNMLAVAIAIAEQTSKNTKSAEDFKTAYIQRLRAMSRSYELLSRENWTAAAIGELVAQEIEPFGENRFSVAGPIIRLKPSQAISVGMILHELVTNASKYGALSMAKGRVEIEWSTDSPDGRHLYLTWKEMDGPKVAEPKQRGFGMKLIEREAGFNLGGKASTAFEKNGLHLVMNFPLS